MLLNQFEFLDEFAEILDRRLRYERGEQQLEGLSCLSAASMLIGQTLSKWQNFSSIYFLTDVQKEQREIAALKLHSNREEHSRLDIDSLLK